MRFFSSPGAAKLPKSAILNNWAEIADKVSLYGAEDLIVNGMVRTAAEDRDHILSLMLVKGASRTTKNLPKGKSAHLAQEKGAHIQSSEDILDHRRPPWNSIAGSLLAEPGVWFFLE